MNSKAQFTGRGGAGGVNNSKTQFTQDAEVLTNIACCRKWNTLAMEYLFTQQHQRISQQICVQIRFRILCDLGPWQEEVWRIGLRDVINGVSIPGPSNNLC